MGFYNLEGLTRFLENVLKTGLITFIACIILLPKNFRENVWKIHVL